MNFTALKQKIYGILPHDKKDASAYTQAFKYLFPSGAFWNYMIIPVVTQVIVDHIVPIAPTVNDNVVGTEPIYQDTPYSPEAVTTSSLWGNLISCFATAVWRFQNDWYELYYESIPGWSKKLLPEWEKESGMDEYKYYQQFNWLTQEQKALYIHNFLFLDHTEGLSDPWYMAYAESLGYEIEFIKPDVVNTPWISEVHINSGVNTIWSINLLTNDLLRFKPSHAYWKFVNNL